MKPGIHCARTRWIRGFMTFHRVRRIQTVMLMVPTWPESGFLSVLVSRRSLADREHGAGGADVTGLFSR
jgi:hypothetical protein